MLVLQHITLLQFRNYVQQSFAFNKRVTGICGQNGSGKTNLLDAIYYLGFTRSYFGKTDSQNVHHELQGLRLEGIFNLHNAPYTTTCIVRENNKKELSVNDAPYKKLSEHIGRFPCVMVAPDDVALIIGGSEERRKFIDTILSQLNPAYLQQLIQYNKLLQQRNSLLKQAAENGYINEALLSVYSAQLCERGSWLFAARTQFLQPFLTMVALHYQRIAQKSDTIGLHYESDLQNNPMEILLQNNRKKDAILQRTTAGIHKDELVFTMSNTAFKSEASQGQRKSLLFALKLAEWQTLKEHKGFTPILLLDDVFEKLDEQRMHNLLQWVCTEGDGQIFISDTHKKRLQEQLSAIHADFELIEL